MNAAETLFAEHGFHGTSVRDVAAEAKLPLASTVYHFAKKEQLYTAVLGVIAEQLTRSLDDAIDSSDPKRNAEGLARALVQWALEYPARVRLLLRELLDNPTRVARAAHLPLSPFVKRATAVVAAAGVTAPETAFLHVIGGLSYVVVSRPTMERIVGAPRARAMHRSYEPEALAFARLMFGVR